MDKDHESTAGRGPLAFPRSVISAGLWMRAGLAGAAIALAAPALVARGELSPATGVVALVGAAALAVFSYRRTRRLLGVEDDRAAGREATAGVPYEALRLPKAGAGRA